jgi:hypothetical protein
MRRISVTVVVIASLISSGVGTVAVTPAAAQGDMRTSAPQVSYMEPRLNEGAVAPPAPPVGADGVRLEGSWVGPFTFVNVHSGKCMDILGASMALEARAVQYTCVPGGVSQQWFIWLVTELQFRNSYYIGNAHSGQCLTPLSGARGVEVVQTLCVNGASQDWWVENSGNPEWDRNWENDYSGFYLEVAGASTSNFAGIVQWTYHGRAHQEWELWDV